LVEIEMSKVSRRSNTKPHSNWLLPVPLILQAFLLSRSPNIVSFKRQTIGWSHDGAYGKEASRSPEMW